MYTYPHTEKYAFKSMLTGTLICAMIMHSNFNHLKLMGFHAGAKLQRCSKYSRRWKKKGIIVIAIICILTLDVRLSSKVCLSHLNTEGASTSEPQQSPFRGSRGRRARRARRGERTGQTLRPVSHTQPQTERHHSPPSNCKSRPVLPPDSSQYPLVPWRRRRRRACAAHRHQRSDQRLHRQDCGWM